MRENTTRTRTSLHHQHQARAEARHVINYNLIRGVKARTREAKVNVKGHQHTAVLQQGLRLNKAPTKSIKSSKFSLLCGKK